MFKKRKRFLIGGLVVVLAIVYLGYIGFMGSATYYYTVSEFLASKDTFSSQAVRVNGEVAPGSVEQEDGGRTLRFIITEGNDSLHVVYHGVVPDTFKAGNDTVVEGRLDSAGIFVADELMPKCASKYESQ